MNKVFFDTWGWVAIAHKDDSHHSGVYAFYKDFLISKGIPVTTDYILAETITLLRSRTDHENASVFIDTLLNAAKEGLIQLYHINENQWNKAWQLSKKYHDKPYISFIDFTSFVIMKEYHIYEVLTADKHFKEVGMGFKKLF